MNTIRLTYAEKSSVCWAGKLHGRNASLLGVQVGAECLPVALVSVGDLPGQCHRVLCHRPMQRLVRTGWLVGAFHETVPDGRSVWRVYYVFHLRPREFSIRTKRHVGKRLFLHRKQPFCRSVFPLCRKSGFKMDAIVKNSLFSNSVKPFIKAV